MNCPIPGGLFVAVEGIDGAGKSVQIRTLAATLHARGLDVVLTREPTDGPWGRRLRASATQGRLSPEEELHAFLEDRTAHVRDLIRPSLAANRIVITDRYYFSTVAYQGARGFDPDDLLRRNEAIALEPHLLLLLDLPPEISLARIGLRDGAPNHFESLAQLRKVRDLFLALRKPYLVRIDAARPPAEVQHDVLRAVTDAAIERLRHSPLPAPNRLEALAAFCGPSPATA